MSLGGRIYIAGVDMQRTGRRTIVLYWWRPRLGVHGSAGAEHFLQGGKLF